MIDLRFCPRCGNALEPDKKFCTNCGASLRPDLADSKPSPQPDQPGPALPRFTFPALTSRTGLLVAGLVALILIAIFIGLPLITGTGILPPAGANVTPVPTMADRPGDSPAGSYVIVKTEEPTPLPTSPPPGVATTPATLTPVTTSPTMVQIPESVVCPSDRHVCNNTCVDLQADNSSCGRCGNSCPAGTSCRTGNCVLPCSAGLTNCPDGCFDLLTNPRHCGSCGNSCPAGLICVMGRCDSPATPMPVPQ